MRYYLINSNSNSKRKLKGYKDLQIFVEKKKNDDVFLSTIYRLYGVKEITLESSLYREDKPEKRRKEDYTLTGKQLIELMDTKDCPIFPKEKSGKRAGRKKKEIEPKVNNVI